MSNSRYVCSKDGIPVHGFRGGWKHSLGGRTGAIPKHRKHRPVPVLRAEYDRAYSWDTPKDEARALLAKFRQQEREQAGEGDMIFPKGQGT